MQAKGTTSHPSMQTQPLAYRLAGPFPKSLFTNRSTLLTPFYKLPFLLNTLKIFPIDYTLFHNTPLLMAAEYSGNTFVTLW